MIYELIHKINMNFMNTFIFFSLFEGFHVRQSEDGRQRMEDGDGRWRIE